MEQPLQLPSMRVGLACLMALALAAPYSVAAPTFASTSDAEAWQVAVNVGGVDGQFSSFPTTGFAPAVAMPWRTTDGTTWIANNESGTNGPIGDWTFFVFRQTFDFTGYDPVKAVLSFQWAADDSGEGVFSRGSWTPKYSVNGGPLIAGTWPTTSTYDFGLTQAISSGFVSGVNTIDFYVEGNGQTDGMALGNVTLAVPEPASVALLAIGLGAIALLRRRIVA